MANIPIKDGAGASVELKARGAGTSGDPYVPQQEQTLAAQLGAAANTATAAANTAVTITYAAAGSGLSHAIDGVVASLSADPVAAVSLTIANGGTTVFQTDITRSGAAPIDFPVLGGTNTAMTITLAAAGTGVIGKLNAKSKRVV